MGESSFYPNAAIAITDKLVGDTGWEAIYKVVQGDWGGISGFDFNRYNLAVFFDEKFQFVIVIWFVVVLPQHWISSRKIRVFPGINLVLGILAVIRL